MGAYVTTSFFSEAVQREVHDDQYPVFLLNGANLATEVTKLQLASGYGEIKEFLECVDAECELQVNNRRSEEILWDY